MSERYGARGARDFAIQGLSHLALVSSDMAATVEFYTRVLGMRLVMTIGAPVAAWVEPAYSRALASRNELATRSRGRRPSPVLSLRRVAH